MIKHLPLFFLLLIPSVPAATHISPVTFRDISYVKDAGERQQLDIYLPANYKKAEKPLPVIVFLHGGYWEFGDKRHVAGFAEGCAKLGFAAAAVNYRFVPDNPMPAQIEDVKAAIRWLRANAEKYKLDTERFGVWGYSAGGHLSALLATTGDTREFDVGENLEHSSAVLAACDVAGPTDFEAFAEEDPSVISECEKVFGGSREEKEDLIRKMGSVNHVGKTSSPILILHAEDDDVVLVSQARLLHKTMKAAGAVSYLYVFPEDEGGHGSPRLFDEEAQKLMVKFFMKHVVNTEIVKP